MLTAKEEAEDRFAGGGRLPGQALSAKRTAADSNARSPLSVMGGKTLELLRWDDGVTTNWLFPFAEQDGGTPFCFNARVVGLDAICLCSAGAGEGHLY